VAQDGSKAVLWEHLDWIIHTMPVKMAEATDIAEQLKEKIASEQKELEAVVTAMDNITG
jgi:hypothetical protein